ncbi:MAG: LysE family transporter [Lacrimispora sp.]
MFVSTVLAYLPYAFVTAFTPGPNNILALYAVSRNGWTRGRDTVLGIGAGFLCVMLISGVFCYQMGKYIPALSGVLKYVGAAYIFWLAIHVARSKPAEEEKGRQMSFWSGFFLQFVNVKIIMYAITAYTGYVLPVSPTLQFILVNAVLFTVIGVSGVVTWAAAGGILQKFLWKHYRPFNLFMALVLIVCAVKLL